MLVNQSVELIRTGEGCEVLITLAIAAVQTLVLFFCPKTRPLGMAPNWAFPYTDNVVLLSMVERVERRSNKYIAPRNQSPVICLAK